MNRWTLPVVLFVAIVVGVLALVFVPAPAKAPVVPDPHADLIVANTPKPNDTVDLGEPLLVTGVARGTWYFEASFPLDITSDDVVPVVLLQTYAEAQSDWMTTNFVPFVANVDVTQIDKKYSGKKGWVVLKKDNPSGDAVRDDQIRIPIIFR